MGTYTKEYLAGFAPRHAAFVGIDSDGCVFPTMELKQQACFHPEIIRRWGLEPIGALVRETAEFVSLRSRWRGSNRFPALVRTFDLLRDRPEVVRSGAAVPRLDALRRYVASGRALSNAALEAEAGRTGDPELAAVLAWSRAVNACIERTVRNVPPYAWARRSIERMSPQADLLVVSQTPEEALVREWREHGLDRHVFAIAGQELGTKGEHLALAAGGKYPAGRSLVIGDAPGDRQAALAVDALFYPIDPGGEEESWRAFCETDFDRFLAGAYAGECQARLVARFEALLPEHPPWRI